MGMVLNTFKDKSECLYPVINTVYGNCCMLCIMRQLIGHLLVNKTKNRARNNGLHTLSVGLL